MFFYSIPVLPLPTWEQNVKGMAGNSAAYLAHLSFLSIYKYICVFTDNFYIWGGIRHMIKQVKAWRQVPQVVGTTPAAKLFALCFGLCSLSTWAESCGVSRGKQWSCLLFPTTTAPWLVYSHSVKWIWDITTVDSTGFSCYRKQTHKTLDVSCPLRDR